MFDMKSCWFNGWSFPFFTSYLFGFDSITYEIQSEVCKIVRLKGEIVRLKVTQNVPPIAYLAIHTSLWSPTHCIQKEIEKTCLTRKTHCRVITHSFSLPWAKRQPLIMVFVFTKIELHLFMEPQLCWFLWTFLPNQWLMDMWNDTCNKNKDYFITIYLKYACHFYYTSKLKVCNRLFFFLFFFSPQSIKGPGNKLNTVSVRSDT